MVEVCQLYDPTQADPACFADSPPPECVQDNHLCLLLKALARIENKMMFFLEGVQELSEEMREITKKSYQTNFWIYKFLYEHFPDMLVRTIGDYLAPFVEAVRTVFSEEEKRQVLLVGSGTGKDAKFLAYHNLNVLAVDISDSMVGTMKQMELKQVQTITTDIRHLTQNPQSLIGILAESALQHINKSEVKQLIPKFAEWLVPGGVLLIRLRRSPTGGVFMTRDAIGERYFTSWTEGELTVLTKILSEYFDIFDTTYVEHKEPGRPGFFMILARRKS